MGNATREYEYDVCLSFAGEQRPYVEEVAKELRGNGVKVFYDRYEQATLWGKDLYEHLDRIYQNAARYCILFASADYARKIWTSHERRSAQARAITEHAEYILPVRFDDTVIPGVRDTVGYIDARELPPRQLVNLVIAKMLSDIEVLSNAPEKSTELPSKENIPAHAPRADKEWRHTIRLLPRKPDGPIAAEMSGANVRALMPLEGGGRLGFELSREAATGLAERLKYEAEK